jgi:3-oxoacyl-[acyl-carrier-protein] synthase III
MCFKSFPEHAKALRVHGKMRDLRVGDHLVARLFVEKDPALADRFLECIAATVATLLESAGLTGDAIKVVLPPQVSPEFIGKLADKLSWPRAKFVDVSTAGDLFTSSLPYAFARLRETGYPPRGDIGLIINVGAGLQVGCALYHF